MAGTVELLVAGMRIRVPGGTGHELLERDRELLAEGRTETAAVAVPGAPPARLHVVLGAGALALLEPLVPDGVDPEGEPEPAELDVEQNFPDFDAYLG